MTSPGRIHMQADHIWVKYARTNTADWPRERIPEIAKHLSTRPRYDWVEPDYGGRPVFRFSDGVDVHPLTDAEIRKVPFLEELRREMLKFDCKLYVVIFGDKRIVIGTVDPRSDPLPESFVADLVANFWDRVSRPT